MKCPKCLFDNPSDAGLPKIADAKKRLVASRHVSLNAIY